MPRLSLPVDCFCREESLVMASRVKKAPFYHSYLSKASIVTSRPRSGGASTQIENSLMTAHVERQSNECWAHATNDQRMPDVCLAYCGRPVTWRVSAAPIIPLAYISSISDDQLKRNNERSYTRPLGDATYATETLHMLKLYCARALLYR